MRLLLTLSAHKREHSLCYSSSKNVEQTEGQTCLVGVSQVIMEKGNKTLRDAST